METDADGPEVISAATMSAGTVGTATAGAPAKPRGRPRDPLIEDAVLRATRYRLAVDGYTRMTIGDIAADAGVTRPTVYRRWPSKHDLVVDALDYGFRTDQAANPPLHLDTLPPRDALIEAVRRLNPRAHNPNGIMLVGNVLAEAAHNPALLEMVRIHALQPRQQQFIATLRALQDRGALRAELNLDTLADLCTGSYLSAFLRTGDDAGDLPARIVETLWPTISTAPPIGTP
jgi:AcrR family transcriptional regulator